MNVTELRPGNYFIDGGKILLVIDILSPTSLNAI